MGGRPRWAQRNRRHPRLRRERVSRLDCGRGQGLRCPGPRLGQRHEAARPERPVRPGRREGGVGGCRRERLPAGPGRHRPRFRHRGLHGAHATGRHPARARLRPGLADLHPQCPGRHGHADAILAGGTEACIHPLILAGFTSMRGLASANGDPTKASRPFDATRAGFVMAEGAGVVHLETLDSAKARGAPIYAEVLGYGASNDAYHMAAPDPESVGVVEMMRQALDRAGVAPEEVDYINAHGTSTPLGDLAETKAIKEVFGDHAYEIAVSSTKSVMGHTFGAAGAIEAIMCALAIHHGVIPPTINYENPDPACDLDYVPNEARKKDVRVALSNAMGLGGHNGCVLLGRVDD